MNIIKLQKDPEGGWLVTQGNLDSGCLSPDEALGIIAHALYGDGSPHRYLKPQAKMPPKLLPCPMCGSDADVIINQDDRQFQVICDARGKGCGSSSGFRKNELEAIELWNTRESKSNAITVPSHYVQLTDVPEPTHEQGVWIPWYGGKCPVDADTLVNWRLRNGSFSDDLVIKEAGSLVWTHCGDYWDIVAYRVHKPETEGTENEGSDHD